MDICKPKTTFRPYFNASNPFISLVESVAQVNTVFAKRHHELADFSNVITYEEQPLWIEVIHKNNKLNIVDKHLPQCIAPDLIPFGIETIGASESHFMIHFNNVLIPLRKAARQLLNLVKNISSSGATNH